MPWPLALLTRWCRLCLRKRPKYDLFNPNERNRRVDPRQQVQLAAVVLAGTQRGDAGVPRSFTINRSPGSPIDNKRRSALIGPYVAYSQGGSARQGAVSYSMIAHHSPSSLTKAGLQRSLARERADPIKRITLVSIMRCVPRLEPCENRNSKKEHHDSEQPPVPRSSAGMDVGHTLACVDLPGRYKPGFNSPPLTLRTPAT